MPYCRITREEDGEILREVLNTEGPCLCEVVVDETQNFAPKSSSKVLPDGRIVSPSLNDMAPFLDRADFESNIYKG